MIRLWARRFTCADVLCAGCSGSPSRSSWSPIVSEPIDQAMAMKPSKPQAMPAINMAG